MSAADDDGDVLVLSENTLALLKGFYAEQIENANRLEDLKTSITTSAAEKGNLPVSIATFKEDWHASQFWFRDDTAEYLAKQLLRDCTEATCIAVVSAPSVFVKLRNLLLSGDYPTPARACLLEYDERFEMLEGFVKYDFNQPTDLPEDLEGAFDRILWDPPYHSAACMREFAKTVEWLAKPVDEKTGKGSMHKITCTGETMQDVVTALFADMKVCDFQPQHTNRLDNRYVCLADFEFREEDQGP